MIPFLLNNKMLIVVLILVAVLGASLLHIRILKSDIETLELQKAAVESSLKISNASIETLTKNIEEQNSAVEKLKTAADERTLKFLDELAAAKSASDTFKKQAADILKRTSPQNISKCDAANQLMLEEIRSAK